MIQAAIQKMRTTVSGKLMLTAGAVAGSVALPQIVHWIGIASGTANALGELLLPMHFFVLLAGLLAGPAVGAMTGALAPMISFLLSGMPAATVLPFMTAELIGYGLVAGLLCNTDRLGSFSKLLLAQLGGRVLRFATMLFASYALGMTEVQPMSVLTAVKAGLVGILLQWCILPLLLKLLRQEART